MYKNALKLLVSEGNILQTKKLVYSEFSFIRYLSDKLFLCIFLNNYRTQNYFK
jgi:hypothetical protein